MKPFFRSISEAIASEYQPTHIEVVKILSNKFAIVKPGLTPDGVTISGYDTPHAYGLDKGGIRNYGAIRYLLKYKFDDVAKTPPTERERICFERPNGRLYHKFVRLDHRRYKKSYRRLKNLLCYTPIL